MHCKPPDARISHLNHGDLVHLIGDADESVIASILATGATYAEVEQALKGLGDRVERPRLNAHGPTPTAELVYDILESSMIFNDRESRMSR